MKILHLLEATQGGTRRHVLDLLPALQRRGLQCELIYSSLRYPAFCDDARVLEAQGIPTHDVPMTRSWGGKIDAQALIHIRDKIKHSSPNVIHCHSTKAGLLGRLAVQSTLMRIPVVYTPHCLAFDTGLPLRQRRAARYLEKLLAPSTAHFIAVSAHEKRAMQRVKLAPGGRISMIHNGVDLDDFDRFAPATLPSSKYFTLGCFGRLSRQKNQTVLLGALTLLREKMPSIRLLLIGGGEDEAMLRSIVRRCELQELVTFVGEQAEPRPWYFDCDVVVQPSRWESCPYSVLEAMSARRAVLASPVGGVPELLGEDGLAGIFCQPCTAEVIAQRVLEIAGQTSPELGDSARERVEKYFGVETMVEKTMAVYDKVL
jgi:glycosyltransferase involved in cell wall biosynthesis